MTGDLLRDDARVREAFRRGERWALAEVYRVYFPLVSTVATRGFGGFRGFYNPCDRDDAIQTIFAAALEERARLAYNGLDPYGKFLRGIAQNTCRRMLEKAARFRRTDGQPELVEAQREQERCLGVLDQLIDLQEQEVVRRFVASIDTEPDRTVLRAYFVEGTAEETIAKDIGLTRYRVRKVVATLYKRMKRFLSDHGIQ